MEKPEKEIVQKLHVLLKSFENDIEGKDIRQKVLELVPLFNQVRLLGKAAIPNGLQLSARERILAYFQEYPRQIIHEKELLVVGGISEWARRVRELRVQFGWKIVSGLTIQSMLAEGEIQDPKVNFEIMGSDDYILLDVRQDKKTAYRWNVANEIRKSNKSMRDKILTYFRKNVGEEVSGEELRYIAKGSEWARRVRELRTEQGWPISTRLSGHPTLPIGVYMLEADRQAPVHDRRISEQIRRTVLLRDKYRCTKCGWNYDLWNPSDPRFLEVHHVILHSKGGDNSEDNLMTYCNVCHDSIHKLDKKG